MENKRILNALYDEIVAPLENYTDKTNTVDGMMSYAIIFHEVIINFTEKMNKNYVEMISKSPDKKEEINDYITELHNKLISTYKPK